MPRDEGPLLVFARALPPYGYEIAVHAVPLDWEGKPTGSVRPLGMRMVRERISVVAVDNGFVVASVPLLDDNAGAVAAALFNLEGELLQELDSPPLARPPRPGVHAVASPDGRSVMVGWMQEPAFEESDGYGVPTLLRFDCVDPQ